MHLWKVQQDDRVYPGWLWQLLMNYEVEWKI